MNDLISRQAAIDMLEMYPFTEYGDYEEAREVINRLPSVEPEMIREIRKWINSNNRGRADYFIVDKIEEIINKYE